MSGFNPDSLDEFSKHIQGISDSMSDIVSRPISYFDTEQGKAAMAAIDQAKRDKIDREIAQVELAQLQVEGLKETAKVLTLLYSTAQEQIDVSKQQTDFLKRQETIMNREAETLDKIESIQNDLKEDSKSIRYLTKWLVGLTVTLGLLTLGLMIPELYHFYKTIMGE